ncbi:macrophage migration inhibitory factor-like [Hyla sarda]|uniref:macrophage migration inhibitory factor-like n=1 Tax=Hyla sarda TaxID=327740 RepID=UPI0024C3BDDD|nr:macrophage migration inhibitory factor-like [Hyla sarda]
MSVKSFCFQDREEPLRLHGVQYPGSSPYLIMPIFTLHTNLCQSAIPQTFMSDLSQLLEQAMDVPAKFFAVIVHTNQQMTFAGTKDRCGLCSLQSIGKTGGPRNENYSKILGEFLNKQLGIPSDRVYITFIDVNGANVGWNGSTFAGVAL